MNTDRIEKQIVLNATQSRVWQALTDSAQFGHWFGAKFDEPFAVGARIKGAIAGTTVNPEVAKMQEPYAGKPFVIVVEKIEPETRFSFRWHPYAPDDVDTDTEPMTLVEFTLKPVPDGTLLTVTESGFDQLPDARRAEAFAANEGGWEIQTTLIDAYLNRGGVRHQASGIRRPIHA